MTSFENAESAKFYISAVTAILFLSIASKMETWCRISIAEVYVKFGDDALNFHGVIEQRRKFTKSAVAAILCFEIDQNSIATYLGP